jgi:hypothetical protein
MRGFADGNYQNPAVGIEIMQIFADPEHAALTIHMPLECSINAGFRERVLKEMARGNTHVEDEIFAMAGSRRHLGNYTRVADSF